MVASNVIVAIDVDLSRRILPLIEYIFFSLENPPLVMIDPETKEFYKVGYKEYTQALEEQQRKEGNIISITNTPPEAKRY